LSATAGFTSICTISPPGDSKPDSQAAMATSSPSCTSTSGHGRSISVGREWRRAAIPTTASSIAPGATGRGRRGARPKMPITRARGSVGSRSFVPARSDHQALAELGFVVVAIDGMGTRGGRSKTFRDAAYGKMEENTLPDQVAAIKQLAARYPWIDGERIGIWGHSG